MNDFVLSHREVIPDQTVPEKVREITLNTGGTQSTLQDIKIAEKAGGYCFKDASKYYTRNRFIFWRTSHDVLELADNSLDVNLLNAKLRYKFTDTPVLDGVSMHETRDSLILLVPTVCSVHVLSFPHPDINRETQDVHVSHPDLMIPSIFSNASATSATDPTTFHIINHSTISNAVLPHVAASTYNELTNHAVFVFAYNTGSILFVQFELGTGKCTSTELKQDGIMPRFLSGITNVLRGKGNEQSTIVSIVLHTIGSDVYALGLGQDGHIRMWSCEKACCIAVTDVISNSLNGESILTQGVQSHVMRVSTEKDSNEMMIGVFLCFSNKSQFHILHLTFENNAFNFQTVATLMAPEKDLVNFCLNNQRIWATWRGASDDCTVSSSNFQRPGEGVWVPIVLEPAPPAEFYPTDATIDPRQVYADYIFFPGRFPIPVITKALSIYRRSAVLSDVSISPSLLKQRVCMAVESEIQSEVMEYELSDDDYLEIANRCWARFYSCCAQYNATGARPLGMLMLPTMSALVLLRKSTFSLLRPMETLEHLFMCGEYTNSEQLIENEDLSSDLNECNDLLQLTALLSTIEQGLTDEIKENFNRELHCLRPPDQVAAELIEEIIAGDEDCGITAEQMWDLCHRSSKISDVYKAMHKLLEILRLDKAYPELESTEEDDIELKNSIDHLYSSKMGISTVTQCIHQLAIIRFSICRNLLLLQHILLKGWQQDWSILEASRSVCMPDTVVFTQAYFTIVWLCETPASIISVHENERQRLSMLNLPPILLQSRIGGQRLVTVPELFILGGGTKSVYSQFTSLHPDPNRLAHWHQSLLIYIKLTAKLFWPVSGSLLFAEWFLGNGQYTLLQKYVRLLGTWCEWNNYSRQFLLAVALLACGERYKALDLFKLAANGIFSDRFIAEKMLPSSGVESESKAFIEYYLKVIHLLELHNALDCVITIAETAIGRAEPNEPHLATLHSIIFVHHLTLEHYEKAYDSLDANPDLDRRKDCLRQLVGTLLDKRELNVLLKFPYVNMCAEFESIVTSRARAISLEENFYYDFLYAFHIGKENYRRAGVIMYEQAYMLSQNSENWALERQAKSYLACINALSLAEENHQYILRPQALVDDQPVTELIEFDKPDKNFDAETVELEEMGFQYMVGMDYEKLEWPLEFNLKRDIEIMNISDIKKDLAHATARLQLIKVDTAVQISANTSPEELVGLLTNQNMYDVACSLCSTFNLCYAPVLESLTSACLRVTHNAPVSCWEWLSRNNVGELAMSDADPQTVCWRYLRTTLEKYEQPNLTTLHQAVARRIIAFREYVPHWLYASYKKRNAAELIRLFHDNGRVIEACNIAMDYIWAALGKGKEYFGLKSTLVATAPPLCLPVHIFIELLAHTEVLGETDLKYRKSRDDLLSLLEKYMSTVKRVSQDMEKIGWQRNNELQKVGK